LKAKAWALPYELLSLNLLSCRKGSQSSSSPSSPASPLNLFRSKLRVPGLLGRYRHFWSQASVFWHPAMTGSGRTDLFYNRTFYLALMQLRAAGSGGAFGFAYSGTQLANIGDYTAPPNQWSVIVVLVQA
jgi:hypothetical protein